MLNLATRNTGKLVREKSKSENVRLGRLFTKRETARLMAEMLKLDGEKTAFTVLDAGAGTGILSAAAIEEICKRCPNCKQIFLTCYETNTDFIPMLEDNLERIRKKCRHDYGVRLFVTIYEENYILNAKNHYTVTFFDTVEDKYDIIIMNPPSSLVEKGSEEALSAGGVTQLKIGSEFLFLQTSVRHLEEDGQLVTVLPTTYASASQLSALRREINERLTVTKMHLFIGKPKNAKRETPLKKNFIIALSLGAEKKDIEISTSTDSGKAITRLCPLPYGLVVDKDSGDLTLVQSEQDARIVKYFSAFPENLTTLGLRMSTGLVVDSKCEGLLFTEPIKSSVPLIRHQTIIGGTVNFPQPIKRQYIAPVNPYLIQKNKNMIMLKRVAAKSDDRLLNPAIYLASQLPAYKYVSTHNKINFIDTKNKNDEMSTRLVFGLFALLNSTVYDRYVSIVSKSKQINSKEMKKIPLPPKNLIESMGVDLMYMRQTSVSACDQIVNRTLHITMK